MDQPGSLSKPEPEGKTEMTKVLEWTKRKGVTRLRKEELNTERTSVPVRSQTGHFTLGARPGTS